jgi:hypothetical protein
MNWTGDRRRGRVRQHTTGVAFGARGDKVVASYHGDHAYSFDTTGSSHRDSGHTPIGYGRLISLETGKSTWEAKMRQRDLCLRDQGSTAEQASSALEE